MNPYLKCFLILLVIVSVAGGIFCYKFLSHGISARDNPMAIEAFMARSMRHMAVPSEARKRSNPLQVTPEIITAGREHFADHCATCHANDGSGQTTIGKNLYPKAPDMRLTDTQKLSDGELFYIIENGIRLTGMPAWGTGKKEGEEATWMLVHFIRHLPKLTSAELKKMQQLNPRSPKELQDEEETKNFLEGNDTPHKH